MRNTILAAALILLLPGCRTADSGSTSPVKGEEFDNGLTEKCPLQPTMCASNYDPTVCSVREYDQKPIDPQVDLRVWASNSCNARKGVLERTCELKLSIRLLGKVECVPDATNGHCPAIATKCQIEGKTYTCESTRYNQQFVQKSSSLSVTGKGKCQTTNLLRALACSKNLDPDQLGEIVCKVKKQKQELQQ